MHAIAESNPSRGLRAAFPLPAAAQPEAQVPGQVVAGAGQPFGQVGAHGGGVVGDGREALECQPGVSSGGFSSTSLIMPMYRSAYGL